MATNFLRYLLFSSTCFFCLLLLLGSSTKVSYALKTRSDGTTSATHHTIELSSLLPESVCNPSSKGAKIKGSLKVIHRHGPCSQLSQDKAKPAPTKEEILSHDQSRVNSIQSRLALNTGKDIFKDTKATFPAKSGALLGSSNYFVTVGLGTPKRDLSLIFDTGSDLTWTQCQPCLGSCYSQKEPIFAPAASTSYSNITCSSSLCSDLFSATRRQPRCSSTTCVYGIQYGDGSFSAGYFGREKLTLTSSDVIDGFLFGCGQSNQGLFKGVAGLMGLGRDKLSIVSQSAQKYGQVFSYCLPSRSSFTGYLTFGNSGISNAIKFTPLSTVGPKSLYSIDIIAIYVGGQKLPISSTVFSTAGTIIDSGTVITRLPPAAYDSLRTAFRAQMTKYPTAEGSSLLDTCYDFSSYTNVTIPVISFEFSGNVKVDILGTGTFFVYSAKQICLAYAGNRDASQTGIFGNVQQKTLQVVYDVGAGKLGFSPGGCA